MKLHASRSRKASFAAIGSVAVVVAALGAGCPRAQAAEAPAASAVAGAQDASMEIGANPFAARFPNLVLKTHEGKTVRFYDDLLKGKIVMINFMYATCKER